MWPLWCYIYTFDFLCDFDFTSLLNNKVSKVSKDYRCVDYSIARPQYSLYPEDFQKMTSEQEKLQINLDKAKLDLADAEIVKSGVFAWKSKVNITVTELEKHQKADLASEKRH